MMIIGVDYHPSFQTIAFLMEETGECGEQELHHSDGQAEKFLHRATIAQQRVRMATGAAWLTGRNSQGGREKQKHPYKKKKRKNTHLTHTGLLMEGLSGRRKPPVRSASPGKGAQTPARHEVG